MINTPVRLNAYPSLTDPRHTSYEITWGALVGWLTSTHSVYAVKDSAPLFNLTEFSGPTAKKAEALGTSCVILDFDHLSALQLCDVYMRLSQYETVWYTTHSITPTDRRVRCVVLLERRVTPNEYEATWQALAALCGHVDTQCKDIGRRYFVPSHAEDTEHWSEYSPGVPYPITTAMPLVITTEESTTDLREVLASELIAVIKREAKQGKPWACLLKDRAMIGMPLAEQGARDKTLWHLACWYVQRWPDGSAGALVDLCADSIRLMNDPAFTTETLTEKIGRARQQQIERQESSVDLMCNSQGTPVPGQENLNRVLTRDPALVGRFRLNTFAARIDCRDLPWEQEAEGTLRDSDITALQCYCESKYRLTVKANQVFAAIQRVGAEHKYNPVQDYLTSCRWDGVPRLDTWLEDYAGADADILTRRMGARWVISAVARALDDRPTKVDHVLILYGETNLGKSTVLKALFGGDDWFSDQLSALDSKDSAQDLPGKWCIEWAELSTFKRADSNSVKAFVTRTVDHYRPSFGRVAVDVPRHCVFCATTNEAAFLHDPTGNRRFWVVQCLREARIDELRAVRDQIMAEAVVRYRAGEKWWPEREENLAIADATEQYRIEDTWEDTILSWYGLLQVAPKTEDMSLAWILEHVLGLTADKINRAHEMRVAAVLQKLGFKRVVVGARRLRRWQAPDEVMALCGVTVKAPLLFAVK